MKMIDIKKLSDKESEKLLEEKRTEVRNFRFDITGSKVKNIKTGANVRKDVARIMTEIRSRKEN